MQWLPIWLKSTDFLCGYGKVVLRSHAYCLGSLTPLLKTLPWATKGVQDSFGVVALCYAGANTVCNLSVVKGQVGEADIWRKQTVLLHVYHVGYKFGRHKVPWVLNTSKYTSGVSCIHQLFVFFAGWWDTSNLGQLLWSIECGGPTFMLWGQCECTG